MGGAWVGVVVALVLIPPLKAAAIRQLFTSFECIVFAYLQFGTLSNLLGLSLIFDHKSKWEWRCSSSHVGCYSWQVQRGEARLAVIFKFLLAVDIIKSLVQAAL